MHIEVLFFGFADSLWQHFSLNPDHLVYLDPLHATWLEKIVRPLIIYVTLIVLLRFFGKRELAQLNPFDLVVLLTLSNTVQNAIIGDDTTLSGGIVGAVTLLGLNYGVALFKFGNKKVEAFIEGKPVTIIEDGKMNKKALRRELLTKEDLDILAHHEGFENADDIDRCVLDPNGSFLVDGKDEMKDLKFKQEVLKRLDALSTQMKKLDPGTRKSGS